jgi:Transposase IS116/IS110/IS902 family
MISRSLKLDYTQISSLERDPLLKERLRRLRTVPQVISYCGLCGDEKNSADKVLRMPISKQRNKHIQRVLIEAPSFRHPNRATLAIARKMVIYMLAIERRQQDWVPAEQYCRTTATKMCTTAYGRCIKAFPGNEKQKHRDSSTRRLSGPAGCPLGEGAILQRLITNCFGTGRDHKLNHR